MANNKTQQKILKKTEGAVAIEFALVMTFILVPLFLGTVELGRLLYQYNALAKSVRDSTKFLSTVSDTVSNYSTFKLEAECLAVYGNVGCSGSPLATGLKKDNIDIISSTTTVPGIKVVTVSIARYKASLITNFFSAINFNSISVTMRQQEA